MPEEAGGPDLWRLRLTGEGGRLHDTHYVRRLDMVLAGQRYSVPLEFADIDDPEVQVCLDLPGSQWARLHERHGHPSRALSPRSSLLRGAQTRPRTPAAPREAGSVEAT